MTAVEFPLVFPWLTFVATWVLVSLFAVVVYRGLRQPLRRVDPAQRSLLLFALGLLPLSAALAVSLLGVVPALGSLVVGQHCHAGIGCSSHMPLLRMEPPDAIAWAIVILFATVVTARVLYSLLRRSVAVERMLQFVAGSRPDGSTDAGFEVIESTALFAYCTGLFRPRILVSSALAGRLSDLQFKAVLAHERAHARRYDNLRRLLVVLSLWPLPQRWRRSLLHDLATATESACDLEAAGVTGSPDAVASAIRIAGLAGGAQPHHRLSMAVVSDGSRSLLTERVAYVLGQPARRLPAVLTAGSIVLLYTATAAGCTWFAHHAAEFLLLTP